MTREYPQETIGRTLLVRDDGGEYRRVFVRPQDNVLEVGEFTRGPLTEEHYGAPVHYHCVHVEDLTKEPLVESVFSDGEAFLVDLMDALDGEGVSYGYLNDMVGQYVSYRPPRD